jgi:hypothetical protein
VSCTVAAASASSGKRARSARGEGIGSGRNAGATVSEQTASRIGFVLPQKNPEARQGFGVSRLDSSASG